MSGEWRDASFVRDMETGEEHPLRFVPAGGPPVRTFDTGATRDTDAGKLDYEGFLSPLVLRRYAEYMHKHRIQADGTERASDNWQKGIPYDAYMKSKWRHFMDTWTMHRLPRYSHDDALAESLCAEIFNSMGYLHELLKDSVQST
jgi:hypothetical protein